MGTKISDLTLLAGASIASADMFAVVDASQLGSSGATKKTTLADLVIAIGGSYQPTHATLTALSITFGVNTFPARASTGVLTAKPITDYALGLVNAATALQARSLLGVDFANGDRAQFTKTDYGTIVNDGNSGTSKTIDFSAGNVHRVVLNGSCTFTFTPPAGTAEVRLKITADNTGGYTSTWPGTVVWNGGSAPANLVANEVQWIGGIWDGSTYYLDFTPSSAYQSKVTVVDAAGDTTCSVMLAGSATGDQIVLTDAGLTYNATTNALTASTFIGALTGTASGNLVSGGALGTPASGTLTNCTGLPVSSLTAGVLAANITFGENTELVLDAALSADGKYCGITEDGTAAAALAFGEVCYFVAGSSRWDKAKADSTTTSGPVKLGICVLAAAGAASATRMLLMGKIRADAQFPTLTIGAPVFISGAAAGAITTTAPTTTDYVVRIVGYGNTADELYWNPSSAYDTRV